jgi:hypothetical protein
MSKLFSVATILLILAGPALAAPNDEGTASAPAATRPARGEGGVMRYDANKDGAVDRDEWNVGQQARFKRLDTNNDNKLSQDELFARTSAATNSVMPTDRQAARQSTYFQLVDADKDGFVTIAEFMAQADRNFTRCDLDKSSRIDTAECRQALQRRRAER